MNSNGMVTNMANQVSQAVTTNELEKRVQTWLAQWGHKLAAPNIMILSKLIELQERSTNWKSLWQAMPGHVQTDDVLQAIGNVLDQIKRADHGQSNGMVTAGSMPAAATVTTLEQQVTEWLNQDRFSYDRTAKINVLQGLLERGPDESVNWPDLLRWLPKPVDSVQLVSAIESILNQMVTEGAAAPAETVTMPHKGLDQLTGYGISLSLADELTSIARLMGQIERQRNQLAGEKIKLELKGICSGIEYYRDLKSGHQALYANHGTGQGCPLHGEPEDGGRLRTYCGRSDWDQARQTLAAMERYAHHEAIKEDLREMDRELGMAKRQIRSLVATLHKYKKAEPLD